MLNGPSRSYEGWYVRSGLVGNFCLSIINIIFEASIFEISIFDLIFFDLTILDVRVGFSDISKFKFNYVDVSQMFGIRVQRCCKKNILIKGPNFQVLFWKFSWKDPYLCPLHKHPPHPSPLTPHPSLYIFDVSAQSEIYVVKRYE